MVVGGSFLFPTGEWGVTRRSFDYIGGWSVGELWLAVEVAVSIGTVAVLNVRLAQLEEANQPWNHDGQETKNLLEGRESQN